MSEDRQDTLFDPLENTRDFPESDPPPSAQDQWWNGSSENTEFKNKEEV